MEWFRRMLRSRVGRIVTMGSITSFILSLVIAPGPADAMSDSLHDSVKAMRGTHRGLSLTEMKAIEGAATAGTPDPWQASDKNLGGYGVATVGDGNELVSIPIVAWNSRGPGVSFALTWNYANAGGASNPCGAGWTNSYNLRLTVNPSTGDVTVFEGDGRQRLYTYTAGAYVPPPGIHDTLVKNANGSYTLTRKNQTELHFSATYSDSTYGEHLDTITDSNDNQLVIGYQSFTIGGNSVYQAVTVTDATDRVLTLGYDSNSRLSTITDPASRVWNISYDSSGNLTQVSTPRVISGVHTTINLGYTSGDLTSLQDRRGHTWTATYGSVSNLTGVLSVTDPYSKAHSYSWNPYQHYTVSDENGNKVGYAIDSSGRVTGIQEEQYNGYLYFITVDTRTWNSDNDETLCVNII